MGGIFSFFVALFGGTYYGGKYTCEQAKLNKYNKSNAAKERYRNRLKATMCATLQYEQTVKNNILNGRNYEKICTEFGDDFKFVFGSHWQSILKIPPLPPVLDPKIYKDAAYSFYVPANHIYWVYRLILASNGKVDNGLLTQGYSVGGIMEKEMSIKFAQCIERRLISSGRTNLRLVLEQKDSYDMGAIKIETLCNHPYKRVW